MCASLRDWSTQGAGVGYGVGAGWPGVSILYWNAGHPDIHHLNGSPERSGDPDNGAPDTGHFDIDYNHYMQSNPAISLYNATLDYLDDHSGDCNGHQCKICTNDQSLPFGGLFEVDHDWSESDPSQFGHAGHRDGKAADINIASGQCPSAYAVDMEDMEEACEDNGANSSKTAPHPVGSPNHTHCEW